MSGEIFRLLPREDTLLIGKAETIFVGPGAEEAAEEFIIELPEAEEAGKDQ